VSVLIQRNGPFCLILRTKRDVCRVALMCRNGSEQAKLLDTPVWRTDHAGSSRRSVDVQCVRSHRHRRKQKPGDATGNLQRRWSL